MGQPLELRVRKDKKSLSIAFSASAIYELPAELLRVESPSAEVQGHGVGQKKVIGGKKDVTIAGLEPVGLYAVKIMFSDGHKTGFYTWEYLEKLGETQDDVWQAYLTNIKEAGLAREA